VVGEKEEKGNSVSVRSRAGDEGAADLKDFIKQIKENINAHK